MVPLAFAILLCSVVAALAALIENSTIIAVLALGCLAASIEIYALTKSAGGFTAVHIPVLAVNGVLLSAPLLWDSVEAGAIVSLRRFAAAGEFQVQSSVIGIAFTAAYTVGALMVGPRKFDISMDDIYRRIHLNIPNGALVCAGYIAIFISIYGFQGALLQGRYLESRGPTWAVTLSAAGIPIAVLVLSIVAARAGHWRLLAIVGIVILFLITFSRASRMLAIFPLLIIAARIFLPGRRVGVPSAILAGASSFMLLLLPLAGRGNAYGVGIMPLGAQLFTRTEEIFSAFSVSGLVGNILVTAPQTAAVANLPLSTHAFWVSVNPMPGTLAGWNDIKGSLRFNAYTPYNALGELAAQGWPAVIAFAFLVGIVLATLTRISPNLRGGYQAIASLLILAITLRFSLTILQYNLRTGTRLIWWAVFGVAAIWIASTLFDRAKPAKVDLRL